MSRSDAIVLVLSCVLWVAYVFSGAWVETLWLFPIWFVGSATYGLVVFALLKSNLAVRFVLVLLPPALCLGIFWLGLPSRHAIGGVFAMVALLIIAIVSAGSWVWHAFRQRGA